ncbi:MAG TPA: septal ring lytic transglycosylase RlpA family protein [Steroidobacteraceae bacterium]|jgi:rare lipoprotein A|nr:septal ring lytic transglycosylase RlpA family protein [Steroidobacteraceae bacterium]
MSTRFRTVSGALLLGVMLVAATGLRLAGTSQDSLQAGPVPQEVPPPPEPQPLPAWKPAPDRTGRTRVGVASFYADFFAGRVMADGGIMDPGSDNAASRTLPLGTTAKVTNLSTGQSAVVTIEDRGPYAKHRLLDLSPATAEKIGITRGKGIARVKVSPIAVPMPDGSVKAGVAASDPEIVMLR